MRFRPMTAPDPPSEDDLLVLLPRLRRYARVLTADVGRADELVLETLGWASETRSPPWLQRRHWLFAVMHRLHGKRLARAPRAQASFLGADHYGADAREIPPAAARLDRAHADEMLTRFSRLPAEQREVLALVVLEGLMYTEIADVLDVPVGTVMSRLRSARQGMRSVTAESQAPRPTGR